MNSNSPQPVRFGVFKFSLIFAALFFFFVIGFELTVGLLPLDKLLILNGVVIIICTSFLSWLFARIRSRHFTKSEFWRLVMYCLFWSLVLEVYTATLSVLFPESIGITGSLSPWGIAYFYGDRLGINLLCLLLGFGVLGRWIINRKLLKQIDGTA